MAKVVAPNLSSLFVLTTVRMTPNLWYVYTSLVADSLYSDNPHVITARNQNKLVSTMSAEEFCIPLNLTLESMNELFALLEKRNWIREIIGGWYVGEIVEGVCTLISKTQTKKAPKSRKSPPKPSALDWVDHEKQKLLDRRRLESVNAVPPDTRKVAMSAMHKNKDAKSPAARLLQVLKASHEKFIGKTYVIAPNSKDGRASFPKECGFINVFLGYCDNSEETARKMVIWTMKNWAMVKKDLDWLGACNMSFFVTRHCFKRIRELYSQEAVEGFVSKSSTGNRYNEHNAKDAPSEGFGE